MLGFYARGRGAGRRGGDFLTSPEVGPLFGAVVARALDAWWRELGRPDPFVVVEVGAGTGTLAAAVLAAGPACGPALRYVLVERSQHLRRAQAAKVALEPATLALGPMLGGDPDLGPEPAAGSGPVATSLAEVPAGPLRGVVLANELLDNVPFRLLQRGSGTWDEVRVGAGLEEVLVTAPPDVADEATILAPDAPPSSRVPIQHLASRWLRESLASLRRGRVVVVDYGDSTPSMARRPWTDWVRTYRVHGRGGHPLSGLGSQDVTCEVAVDQLARVRRPTEDRSQAAFLAAHGLDELVSEARRRWQEGARAGDLAALAARSRVSEAAALTDAAGLGHFRALEWAVGERFRGGRSAGSNS